MSACSPLTRVRAFCSSGSPRSLKTNEIAKTTQSTLASRTTAFSVTWVARRDSCVDTEEDTGCHSTARNGGRGFSPPPGRGGGRHGRGGLKPRPTYNSSVKHDRASNPLTERYASRE